MDVWQLLIGFVRILHTPEKVLYHCTKPEKVLYENAPPGQGFVLMVQLPHIRRVWFETLNQ
jgi:hypothetical protein